MRQLLANQEAHAGVCKGGKRHFGWAEDPETRINGAHSVSVIERCAVCGRERRRIWGANGNQIAYYIKGTGVKNP